MHMQHQQPHQIKTQQNQHQSRTQKQNPTLPRISHPRESSTTFSAAPTTFHLRNALPHTPMRPAKMTQLPIHRKHPIANRLFKRSIRLLLIRLLKDRTKSKHRRRHIQRVPDRGHIGRNGVCIIDALIWTTYYALPHLHPPDILSLPFFFLSKYRRISWRNHLPSDGISLPLTSLLWNTREERHGLRSGSR